MFEYKGINIQTFLNKTGIKRGFLDADKLESKVSSDAIAMIIAAYPELNIEWLITGVGSMLRNEIAPTTEDVTYSIASDVEVLYQHKSKAIERFWNEQEVPLYEPDAAAGLSAIFSNNRQNIINFLQIAVEFIFRALCQAVTKSDFWRGNELVTVLLTCICTDLSAPITLEQR